MHPQPFNERAKERLYASKWAQGSRESKQTASTPAQNSLYQETAWQTAWSKKEKKILNLRLWMPRPSQIMSIQLCAIEVECARQETTWVIKNKKKVSAIRQCRRFWRDFKEKFQNRKSSTSPTVTLYLLVELRRDSLPGTAQNVSSGEDGPGVGRITFGEIESVVAVSSWVPRSDESISETSSSSWNFRIYPFLLNVLWKKNPYLLRLLRLALTFQGESCLQWSFDDLRR